MPNQAIKRLRNGFTHVVLASELALGETGIVFLRIFQSTILQFLAIASNAGLGKRPSRIIFRATRLVGIEDQEGASPFVASVPSGRGFAARERNRRRVSPRREIRGNARRDCSLSGAWDV